MHFRRPDKKAFVAGGGRCERADQGCLKRQVERPLRSSEVLLRVTVLRRHSDRWPPNAYRRLPCFVNPAFGQTDTRKDPFSAAALHSLPSILTHVGMALGTLESAIQLALLELRAHPRQRIHKVVGTAG